jgi:hypothetical protein
MVQLDEGTKISNRLSQLALHEIGTEEYEERSAKVRQIEGQTHDVVYHQSIQTVSQETRNPNPEEKTQSGRYLLPSYINGKETKQKLYPKHFLRHLGTLDQHTQALVAVPLNRIALVYLDFQGIKQVA